MVADIAPLTLVEGKITEQQAKALSDAVRTLIDKFAGKISHGSGLTGHQGNLDEQFIDVVCPPGANTEFTVVHGLDRVIQGVEVVRKDRAVDVYDSSPGSWTTSLLMLKATVADAQIRIRVW